MSAKRVAASVTVIGGSGFVGRHLIQALRKANIEVVLLSRNLNVHDQRLLAPGVDIRTGNVYDIEFLRANFRGQDAVINLVGILNESGDNGRGFHKAHVDLTKQIIAACELENVSRLLQMSSLNAGRGTSHYLKTRGAAEAAVKASKLQWTIFQPSVIFGVGDGLFTRFAGLLKIAPALPLARANTKFAPVYVGDVIDAMLHALARKDAINKTYELYGTEVFTLREIVQLTAEGLGLKRFVIPLPDFAARIQGFVFDFVPAKPFSSDNYRSLLLDSVGGIDGLHLLGIQPTRIAQVLPLILQSTLSKQARLDRYRYRHH
jgi:uncharacterized protein YbjT (DUF2867 family)